MSPIDPSDPPEPTLAIITDWRSSEDDLPDVAPGEEYERRITPQNNLELRRIMIRDLRLIRLRIGNREVAFQQDVVTSDDAAPRGYRPLDPFAVHVDSFFVHAGEDVIILLRNDGRVTGKPRAALLARVLLEKP